MYPYIYLIPKEVNSRVIKPPPSPQITSMWSPKIASDDVQLYQGHQKIMPI